MHAFRVGAALGAAALLITLAGCTSGPATSDDPADSPLSQYLSALWGGSLTEEEQIEQMQEDNREREELVAECMTEQGFEYLPVVDNGGMMFSSGDEWKPDDREWVAQYGYGMINFPGRDAQPDPGQEYVDPNQDYVEALSESEREAYYEALHGPPVPDEELDENGGHEWNWETAGCYGWSQHEMEADNPATSDEHKPVMDAVNEFYMSMETAPEFAEIDDAWSECMADAGHSGFAKQRDAQMSVNEELNEYYEAQTEWIEDDPALDEIGEREIALALVDLDCREKVDYRAQYRTASWKLEEQFIADHKAELDALKAAAEQGR